MMNNTNSQDISLFCKDIEIEINADNPFANDKLNRESLAAILTEIAKEYSSTGAVIALDAAWGAGKTTFVRMWQQYLLNKGCKALYFNAWETDYIEDPLIALMGELQQVFGKHEGVARLIKASGRIVTKMAASVANSWLEKALKIDGKEVCSAVKAGINETEQLVIDRIKDYGKEKQELESFKTKLVEFVAANTSEYPLVFIIDELDRCNPHYAVKLLERIKHLFEIPNIIFVLATNMQQLQYAVQGFYGSSNINGKDYLQRFINLNISLPSPDYKVYAEYLYQRHSFYAYFDSEERQRNHQLKGAGDVFKNIAVDLISSAKVDLRSANRIYAYTRLALTGFSKRSTTPFGMFFLLCFLKVMNNSVYGKIQQHEYSVQELIYALEQELPSNLFETDAQKMHHVAWAVAPLLLFYNYAGGHQNEVTFTGTPQDHDNYYAYPVNTNKIQKTQLLQALTHYEQAEEQLHCRGIDFILSKVDLVATIFRH